jgi:outer membrane protein TolC
MGEWSVGEAAGRARRDAHRDVAGRVGPWMTAKQRITGARVHRKVIEERYRVGITSVSQVLAARRQQRSEVVIRRAGPPS